MDFQMFVTWVIVGLVTGGSMSFVMKNGGYGQTRDVILGLVGSGAVSTIAAGLDAVSGVGRAAMAAAAFVGAAFIIVLQRKIWPSRTLRSVRAPRSE